MSDAAAYALNRSANASRLLIVPHAASPCTRRPLHFSSASTL